MGVEMMSDDETIPPNIPKVCNDREPIRFTKKNENGKSIFCADTDDTWLGKKEFDIKELRSHIEP
jgi:hypothetical protein